MAVDVDTDQAGEGEGYEPARTGCDGLAIHGVDDPSSEAGRSARRRPLTDVPDPNDMGLRQHRCQRKPRCGVVDRRIVGLLQEGSGRLAPRLDEGDRYQREAR